MKDPTDEMENLSLQELRMFNEISKVKSIRDMSRRLKTSPPQISRALKKIEQKMGMRLIERSISGIELNQNGNLLNNKIEKILESFDEMKRSFNDTDITHSTIGIGSTSFLTNRLVAPILKEMNFQEFRVRPRLLDLSPDQMTSAGLRNAFSLCIHVGQISWPSTWITEKLGDLNWVLCCRKTHPLTGSSKSGIEVNKQAVLKYPFVYPCYWTNEGIAFGNDFFPIPISKRIRGCETSTAEMALSVILSSDELAYVPELLVRHEIAKGRIKTLEIRGIINVTKPVFLSFKSDQITTKFFQRFKSILHEQF